MEKSLFIAVLLALAATNLKAQDYEPIIQEGNEWHTLGVGMSGWEIISYVNYVNWCSGDTIIDDVHYTKLMGTTNEGNPHLFTLLREENGKVWRRQSSTDVLIYDLTASVGDTLRIGEVEEELILDSISIEHIGNVDRKKFWFGLEYDFTGEPYAVETWIEGIGSSYGLLYSGSEGVVGGFFSALCFHQDGELIWQNEYYGTCMVDAVEEEVVPTVSLYPNPTSGLTHIEGIEAAEVQVYNGLGQLVKTVRGSNEVDASGLQEGLYLLRITDGYGMNHTAKMTVKR